MDTNFKYAYNIAITKSGDIASSYYMDSYIKEVNKSIDECIESLKSYENYDTSVKQLKGNIFEAWHAETYNINSAAETFNMNNIFKGTSVRASQDKLNKFATPDITTEFALYGAKSCGDAKGSALSQAISYLEYYKNAKSKSKNPDFPNINDYYRNKGIPDVASKINAPIYEGQIRIIPSDQLEAAIDILKKRALKESYNRPELAYKYIETYNNLVSRIKDPNSNIESIPSTTEQLIQLTNAIKEGTFNPDEYGLAIEEILKMEYIKKQSMNAAISAATLTVILELSQQIISVIISVIKNEEITLEELSRYGIETISVTGKSFIRGYIAGYITYNIKIGNLGNIIKSADPLVIGTIVATSFHLLGKSLELAKGKIKQSEYSYHCMKCTYVASFGLGGAALFQLAFKVPYISALIGNFVGSMVGSILYDKSNYVLLSFCANTGYSFLGFVDQNYSLPDNVLKDMGLDVVTYDSCEYDHCNSDLCIPDECKSDECYLDNINKYIIKRGIIGINKIGYILN